MHLQIDNAKLVGAVLCQITRQRNGEFVDQGLIKRVVDSFVSLGLDNADPDKECLNIYKDQFETAFIAAMEQYYKKESEKPKIGCERRRILLSVICTTRREKSLSANVKRS